MLLIKVNNLEESVSRQQRIALRININISECSMFWDNYLELMPKIYKKNTNI